MTRSTGDHVYARARLYEAAFAYRDVPAEVDVIESWYRAYADRRLRAAIELAAGPAEHARELARRGVRATALDRSAAMCRLAGERADQAPVALSVVRGDMRRFAMAARFDLALTMLDSVSHLLTVDDMVAHLRCTARHLRVGGIYVMECGLPSSPAGTDARAATLATWRCQRDGLEVSVQWGTARDRFDPASQVAETNVVIERVGKPRQRVVDRVRVHHWNAIELEACVRLEPRLAIVGWHGAFGRRARFAGSKKAWRMIVVFKRRRPS
jgi:SAM-dependent methyltransferase